MGLFYKLRHIILLSILLAAGIGAKGQSSTFSYTGSAVAYTVPLGVFSLTIDMAAGNGGSYPGNGVGGKGGRVQCTLTASPGQVLYMYVGQKGTDGGYNPGGPIPQGGDNSGGGAIGGSGSNSDGGAAGGGATDIRTILGNGGPALSSRLVVAGAGGGGSYNCGTENGGQGGGLTGGGGYSCNTSAWSPTNGGAQSSGGPGNGGGTGGGFGPGGNATPTNYGGGGGGGYWGGGGCADGSGGGGSSYTDPTLASNVTHSQGYNTVPNGNGYITFTANCTPPVAGSISGQSLICGTGGSYLYTDVTGSAGGVWSSSNTVLSIDSHTGIATALNTGTATITYSLNYICGSQTPTYVVTVSALPNPIGGATPLVCAGFTTTTALANGGGGTWSSGNTGIATITTGPGSTGGYLTGVVPGNPVITYTLPSGCTTTITASINATPSAIASPVVISGVPQFQICNGTTMALSDASPGGVWSYTGSAITVNSSTGFVAGSSSANTNIITYTYPSTGCYVTHTFTVNPLPNAFNVTYVSASGTNDYCAGTLSPDIQLATSQLGVNYQLDTNGVPFGSVFAGTGSQITWHNPQYQATYTAVGTNATTGCTSNMTGSPSIIIDPAPKRFNLKFLGSTSLCNGATGPDLILDNSETAATQYVLWGNGFPLTYPQPGSGAIIDFGNQMPTTTYTTYFVTAQIMTGLTTCTDTMNFTPLLTMNDTPLVRTVTGGGNICPGASVHIGLDFSDPGNTYTLYDSTSPVITFPGSSTSLDFGALSTSGNYTAVATISATGCHSMMAGSATITINPVPSPYILGIGGTTVTTASYCANGTGIDLQLSGSDAGITYQLWNGSVLDTSITSVVSGPLDLQYRKLGGAYTATATNSSGCTTNMFGSPIIVVQALPHAYPVSGGGNYCPGTNGVSINVDTTDFSVSYQLYNGSVAVPGKTLSGSISGGSVTYPSITGLGNYTVQATNTVSGCMNSMLGGVAVGTYPLPAPYPVTVTNGGKYCSGGTGVHVGVGFSGLGVNYQLYINGSAGPTLPGSSSGLDFGSQTTVGTYLVKATNTTTGCMDTMSNTVSVISNPTPKVYYVTASGSSYCSGGTGIDLGLTSSDPGIKYQLSTVTAPAGLAQAGTGLALDFGLQTLPGSYTINAVDSITGCSSGMFGSSVITINPLPTIHGVTGGGAYCSGGAGTHVGLDASETWINYELYVSTTSGTILVKTMAGTGGALDFGLQTTSGTYSVMAVNPLTTCGNAMSGSVKVSTEALPNVYAISSGGSYCSGGTGVNITLGGSDVGISYQLYNGPSTKTVPAVAGTNASLNFGLQTASGSYMIIATNVASGCTNTMSGSSMITINPLPGVYTLYGGGSFCAGSAGVHVNLSGSASGDNYQLWSGGSKVGGMSSGTGTMLDFGAQTTGGIYTAIATDAITGCSSTMLSTVNVTPNPLPGDQAVTGGGHYCSGTSGVHIGLSGSAAGIGYQLYDGGLTAGLPAAGGGIALDFGLETAGGTYTVIARDAVTGCSKTMSGSATVTIDPLVSPSVSVSTGVGDTVCAGDVITFSPVAVNGGLTPSYSWLVNGVTKAFGATYAYSPVTKDVVSVLMTGSATCAAYPTATGSMIITVKPYVMPSVTITADPGSSICTGTSVTYTAMPVNGGYKPVAVNWIKNSVIVDSGLTYKYVPADKDVVIFMLGSSYQCRVAGGDTVFSNPFKMSVDPSVPPTVTIIAHPGTTLAPGQLDTFQVVAGNAGLTPGYQWYINTTKLPGATNSKYISADFFDGDSLSCNVTSSSACGLSSYNSIRLSVKNLGVGQLQGGTSDVRVLPNPSKGAFTVKGTLGISGTEEVTLELTNMIGQVMYTSKVTAVQGMINEQVALGNKVASGMYLLNLRSASTNNVYHIVIEQ